ncbi:MAG: hypothetical protein Q9173_001497 [Seirophora scorigena]
MDDLLFYLVPTNELAQQAVQSASNRSLRDRGTGEGLVLRIPLPEPTSLRQSPEKTDFLSFGTQPDNRVVLPGLVAAPYHCYLWLRRQQRAWMLTDTSSEGTRVIDELAPNLGETINRRSRSVPGLASLQVGGCAFEFRYPESDERSASVWTQHLDTSPNVSATDDPHTELRMSDYSIGPTLGSGGQGRVLKVLRKRTGFIYALKEITIPVEKRKVLKRQEKEIQYMKTLCHDGILNLLAFNVEPALEHFIVRILMPLCETSLEKIIPDDSIFYGFMRQGCEAMAFLHAHQIIHRDIKPQNILLRDGPPDRYVLADFGYANQVHEAKTICGTPGYMAPEIFFGEPYDAKSDLFSMGVVGLEIRGVFEGIKDEVRELLDHWTVYQGRLQMTKRISQVNVALADGILPDNEGWYKLLAAMTQQDPKARPTALEALDFLAPHSSAYPTKRSTAASEPLAERRSEDLRANLDASKATSQRLPTEKRHLTCAPAPSAPGGGIPIYKDVSTQPLQATKVIHGPGFRPPVPGFRSPTNGLRLPLETSNHLARLMTSPYSQKKLEATTMHGLLKPTDDRAFSELNALEPKRNKANRGGGDRSAKKTNARRETLVPTCLTAQGSRFDRTKVVKRKHRERQKIPDLSPGWISQWYLNGKAALSKRILAFLGRQ